MTLVRFSKVHGTWAMRFDYGCEQFTCRSDIDDKGDMVVGKVIIMHADCLYSFAEAIHNGTSYIIVDNTNTNALRMAPYVRLAEAYGYVVDIVEMECYVSDAVKRNVHNVPSWEIELMAVQMEKPLPDWNIRQHYRVKNFKELQASENLE